MTAASSHSFPAQHPLAVPGARDVQRNLPDPVWDKDGSRSTPIVRWRAGDYVQLRQSWSPMLTQTKMDQVCEKHGFLDEDGYAIPCWGNSKAWKSPAGQTRGLRRVDKIMRKKKTNTNPLVSYASPGPQIRTLCDEVWYYA